jgi:hypothetical protein
LRNTWLLPTGRDTSFRASPMARFRAFRPSTNIRCTTKATHTAEGGWVVGSGTGGGNLQPITRSSLSLDSANRLKNESVGTQAKKSRPQVRGTGRRCRRWSEYAPSGGRWRAQRTSCGLPRRHRSRLEQGTRRGRRGEGGRGGGEEARRIQDTGGRRHMTCPTRSAASHHRTQHRRRTRGCCPTTAGVRQHLRRKKTPAPVGAA